MDPERFGSFLFSQIFMRIWVRILGVFDLPTGSQLLKKLSQTFPLKLIRKHFSSSFYENNNTNANDLLTLCLFVLNNRYLSRKGATITLENNYFLLLQDFRQPMNFSKIT